ncbi:MAG: hypothetical protein KAG66_19520, partial [Methylococcales bacterium]|nr:hypothetical protein [Methylococcales bacterium]
MSSIAFTFITKRKSLAGLDAFRFLLESMNLLTGTFRSALFLLIFSFSAHLIAEELPLLLKEDFTRGFARWETTDDKAWRVRLDDGSSNRVFELYGKSDYETPHRSPFNIALLQYNTVGDFVLTAKVRTTKKNYGHRDMCVFFGYQDPAHF